MEAAFLGNGTFTPATISEDGALKFARPIYSWWRAVLGFLRIGRSTLVLRSVRLIIFLSFLARVPKVRQEIVAALRSRLQDVITCILIDKVLPTEVCELLCEELEKLFFFGLQGAPV